MKDSDKKKPYTGYLYVGLMIKKNEPYLIEYNVRMGDPETEVVFPRINNDVIELFDSMGTSNFNLINLDIKLLDSTFFRKTKYVSLFKSSLWILNRK